MQNRRELLSVVGGVAVTGIAGCTGDSSEPESESSPSEESEPENDSEGETEEEQDADQEQEDGLDLDFDWDDIEQAEIEYHEEEASFAPGDKSAHELVKENGERLGLYDIDPSNPEEVEDIIIGVTYNTVTSLGEHIDGASSTMIKPTAAGLNIELKKALEDTEYRGRMIAHTENGHGSAYFAMTDMELRTVDSNTRNIGTVDEEPLQDRDINKVNDPLVEFDESDVDEASLQETGFYQGILRDVYQAEDIDLKEKAGVPLEILPEYFEKAVLAEDGELFLGPVRDSTAVLETLFIEEQFDDAVEFLDENPDRYEAISLTSTPSELPRRQDYDGFNEYTQELLENHTELIETGDEAFETFYGTV